MMGWLLWLSVVVLLSWLSIGLLLPWLLAQILSLYLGTNVRIGGFRRRLEVWQLCVQTNNFEISIDSLRLTSSIVSSEANNLITLIATGVRVVLRPKSEPSPEPQPDIQEENNNSSSSKTLLLIAQFFGLQIRDAQIKLSRTPILPECFLVFELGELRLDSAVIHHTKLSLACILYHGKATIQHVGTNACLLEANFAFQATLQALVSGGKVSSLEDVGLDLDGITVQLSCALFQHYKPPKQKAQVTNTSRLDSKWLFLIPRQAQLKAEHCVVSLEHTDKSSRLEAELQLLYLSSKCTEVARHGLLPDSHVTAQISAFSVTSVDCDLKIMELAKFQTLIQKEGNIFSSDTQVHECRSRYSPALATWLSPLLWAIDKLDKGEKDKLLAAGTKPEDSSKSLLKLLNHQHQIDAWNTDLVLYDVSGEWKAGLHHIHGSSVGTNHQLSVRQARCSCEGDPVMQVGQFDIRLCNPNNVKQIDVMMTGTTLTYQPALYSLASQIRELVRPALLQKLSSGPAQPAQASAIEDNGEGNPKVALLVSQLRLVWARPAMGGLVFEMRELEGAGDPRSFDGNLQGLKLTQTLANNDEQTSFLSIPNLTVIKKISEWRICLDQKVKIGWRPSLQWMGVTCWEDLAKFKTLLSVKTSNEGAKQAATERPNPASSFHFSGSEKLSIQILYGTHEMKIIVPSMTGKVVRGATSWLQTPQARIKVDRKELVSINQLVFSSLARSDKLTAERRRMDTCHLVDNKCFLLAADTVSLTAPYQFDLNTVILEEFVGVLKWLKTLHKRSPREQEVLPRDILINVKHFRLELTDDPFEVKLRDNYELKKDEYKESEKRLKVLEERIEELRRKNLMFPQEKVEELLKNLKKKNAEIYIQRAMKLYSSSDQRTRLLEWEMRGLEVMVLTDPSMHGRERIIHHLQEFDNESPWPPDYQLEFTSLWCRWIKFQSDTLSVSLRDFPQNLLDIRTLTLWGKVAGAEVSPSKRAIRETRVVIGGPFDDVFVERNMVPLKFYYDIACDVETLSMAYGLCWEPTLTQCSLALNYISGSSKDPSAPLPWWDKVRLLFHGRFLLAARSHQLLLHASLDPYNTTEEMDVSWTDMELIWSEANVKVCGTLDIYVRTASKYDDGHLLHLPNLQFQTKMDWICLANPKDHHSVTPCAPDKLPEYSSNQEHDSYRAFRSSNLNLSVQFETGGGRGLPRGGRPKLDMFSSTLRWFENLKFIFSGATRPIRRGPLFHTPRVRKPHFSRHFKQVVVSVSLHQFQVNYWNSFSQQRGILLNVAQGISLSAQHQLNLLPYSDGLLRRARADWSISYISSRLATSDIWIQSAIRTGADKMAATESSPLLTNPPSPTQERPVPHASSLPSFGRETLSSRGDRFEPGARNLEKSFFFCVEEVLYNRDSYQEQGKPTHRLVIHGARGAWTQSNRDMFFMLYDSWRRAQNLRKNVSSDALKLFHTEKNVSQEKTPFTSPTGTAPSSQVGGGTSTSSAANSPFSWSSHSTTTTNSKQGGSLLDRLLQETELGSTPTAYSEDMSEGEEVKHSLEAMAACSLDDVVHCNWSIELVNSQVLLRGIETKGYVIMSAARASVQQNLHRPVWKERALLSKTTWSGSLESMQYYATVSEEGSDLENIMWLTLDNIGQGGEECRVPGPAGLVGSGKAVGGVVSKVVGVSDDPCNLGIQLQRIVSRCKAEFFYVSYGDTALDDVEASMGGVCRLTGTSPVEDNWSEAETAVNAFSLVHHDLNVCTNSLQYTMVLDIINNLLLYSEPSIKARTDRYLRMRYQFMLEIDNIEDHRKMIIKYQNQLRQFVCALRQTEKEIYLLSASGETKRKSLSDRAADIKDKMMVMNEDLDMMIRCYKETQMSSTQRQSNISGEEDVAKLRRRGEICFSKAAWRLTEIDGQLGIADINISNFLFTRSSMSDDSVENLLEMGYVHVKNLLPNQIYENVLFPTELKRDVPVDRQRSIRIYSRERARVGGISVKDHFEINVAPLTINITAHFYKKMMAFAFPEKEAEALDEDYEVEKKHKKKSKKPKNANFYVEYSNMEMDDVEKMKARAEKNQLFIYIKIPEVPIKVSYKGEKEKNQIVDVADFHLQVPTIEYHNMTWTWLDLLLSVKSRTRESLVTQAIKQKFLRGKATGKEEQAPGEEEKARILLGNSSLPSGSRSSKRFLPHLRK